MKNQRDGEKGPEDRLLDGVKSQDVDALRAAIEDGADVDHAFAKEGRRTALHLAAISGNLSLVQWLTLLGADLEVGDGQGKSALVLAHEAGKSAVVEFLREHGAGDSDE
jgi:ankyrin repeat protein